MGNKARMDHMRSFSEGVGRDDTGGIWAGKPNLQPHFRAVTLKKLEKKARAAQAAEMS